MKPSLLVYLAGILFCLQSCSLYNETYFGNQYSSTDTVETFYAAKDVTKPYKVIGHMNIPIDEIINTQEKARVKLINRAKKVGANALIFSGIDRQTNGDGAPSMAIKAEAIIFTNN